ncbi:MAG: hypothetical protein MUP76_02515 [Acidimicrobiia bacterium]|nr:hypothetical protein [Acidimicrobiia bacterium]
MAVLVFVKALWMTSCVEGLGSPWVGETVGKPAFEAFRLPIFATPAPPPIQMRDGRDIPTAVTWRGGPAALIGFMGLSAWEASATAL